MILVVDGQKIYNYEYQEPPPIASNSLQFVDIEFRLSEEWDGYICTAQFVQHTGNGTEFIASKVLYNNHVTLPDGLVPGLVEISIFGYKAGEAERGTTISYIQPIIRSGFTSTEETPIPPTPDLYAQLLEKFRQQGVSDEVIAEVVKSYLDENPIEITETDPTVPGWAKQSNKPTYTATEVGADASGTAASLVNAHNTSLESHSDIRLAINGLIDRLNSIADSEIKNKLVQLDDRVSDAEEGIEGICVRLDDLEYEPIEILSFASSVAVAEMGSTVNSVNLTWTTNRTPETLTLDGSAVPSENTSAALTSLALTVDKTWTLTATDARGASSAKTATLHFYNGIYYGASASMDISALTKVLSGTKARTFSANAGEGQYIWYLLPARLGTPAFNVGGFDGGFTKQGVQTVENPSEYTEPYNIWRSDNAGLGSVTVKVV